MHELKTILDAIDEKSYGAYRRLKGAFRFEGGALFIDHVQSDPFAPPSRVRLRVERDFAAIPHELVRDPVRKIAVEDFLAREVSRALPYDGSEESDRRSNITIDSGHQTVLDRSACVIRDTWVEARLEVRLPALRRRVLGREAKILLTEQLPEIARGCLSLDPRDAARARDFVDVVERQEQIRALLPEHRLVAFVANGANLARENGASDRPMRDAIPFVAPPTLEVELTLPSGAVVSGMGIPEGVTLIVGGGYHGKTTLLRALERGVYAHIPGDGRELVVTRNDAVKIRAEDGRSITGVDIRPFIQRLPGGKSSASFSTDDASGSTSQAANIVEALEVGAKVLLVDEDSSATNFMIRDARMQALVATKDEPIVSFIDRGRELYEAHGVSTVVVMGGSGDYFDPADRVIKMADFTPEDVTTEAKQIAASLPTGRVTQTPAAFSRPSPRRPIVETVDASRGHRLVRIDTNDGARVRFGSQLIELGAVEQLVDPSQLRAAAHAVYHAVHRFGADQASVSDMMTAVDALFDREGMDVLATRGSRGEHPGCFARPRRFEIASCLNRLRSLRMEPGS